MSAAMASYIVDRVRADIRFLAAQGVLSREAEDAVLRSLETANVSQSAELPKAAGSTGSGKVPSLSSQFKASHIISAPKPPTLPGRTPPPLLPQSQQQIVDGRERVRALWSYAGGQDDDLTFQKGDIIVIESRENEHWCKGFIQGDAQERTGLFPSNHVETIPLPSAPLAPRNVAPTIQAHYASDPEKQALQSYQGGYNAQPVHHSSLAPQPYDSTAPQDVNQAGQKKNFLKTPMGNTLSHAFVGGAGFGVGSALTGEAIRAIF